MTEISSELTDIDVSELARHLEDAHLPTLLLSVVHVTGDVGVLRSFHVTSTDLFDQTGGFSPEQSREIRQIALHALEDFRRRPRPLPRLPDSTLSQMADFVAGRPVRDEYRKLLAEELYGRPDRPVEGAVASRGGSLKVAIIGAGASGLVAAIKLREAGLAFTLLEKNAEVGGTWYENTYPGCGVDVESHLYSYSFAPKNDWPDYFAKQSELKKYWEKCARDFGLVKHIRFRTECEEAAWDDERSLWRLTVKRPDGEREVLWANAVVNATGQLNAPFVPAIKGMDRFRGPSFHSARWNHEAAHEGKVVGVIGNGASAMQIVPTIAGEVDRLKIFYREPQWALFNPRYKDRMTQGKTWLLDHVPYYRRWYRFYLFWKTSDGMHEALQADPDWKHENSINAVNEQIRQHLTNYIVEKIGDDRALLGKLIPEFPPFGKRILIDSGWYEAVKRPNVELIGDPIVEITEDAIVTEAGACPVDLIVYATGFEPLKIRTRITGRGGVPLEQVWGENPSDPRAYLGVTVPELPNFFLMYGPNTNVGSSASVIFNSEAQGDYIVDCLAALVESGAASMNVKPDVHDSYNERADRELAKMVWNHPKLRHTWYRSGRNGRIGTNLPYSNIEYWWMLRHFNKDDFEFSLPAGAAALAGGEGSAKGD